MGLMPIILLFVACGTDAQHEDHASPTAAQPRAGAQASHEQMSMPMSHHMEMRALFGPYPMSREASGTSWQPESTPMGGYHFMAGHWMLMVHGYADLVYDDQGSPRGDSRVFSPNMGMLMAERPLGKGTLGLRGMLSLEPATVGKSGYPLLLQTGETADGQTPLIDRQHPHDLFMELAASYSIPFREAGSVFAYVGYPGEPALGPPTFMHRFSGMAIPEAPILHHWLDSTHITFGVATVGVTWKAFKLEGSSFTGREPDQYRWDFDRPRFDSYSGRVSFNPTPNWAIQLSGGHLRSPEQLEPDVDADRITASVSYNRPLAHGNWQTTAAWGQNRKHGRAQDGVLLESVWSTGGKHTAFGRAEWAEKDELFTVDPLVHTTFSVGKLSLGYIYDFTRVGHLGVGIGALGSVYAIPSDLEFAYGSSPFSFLLFVRGIVH
jgi:hypothetical protein